MGTTDSVTVNSVAEDIVAGGLAEIPYVGHILSDLTETFWPDSDNSVWDEMESEVEALIDQELDHLVYTQVNDTLTGLSAALDDYIEAVNVNDPATISQYWTAVRVVFDDQLPNFQAATYEVLLLPLFAQAVNMYLSLLRDGALYGTTWGWDQASQDAVASDLSEAIPTYVSYAKTYFVKGLNDVALKTTKNDHDCQPFRSVNQYTRQMTLGVADFGQLWPFFDVTKFPSGKNVYLGREIYSDPVGTCDDSGNIVLPAGPAKPPNQITVWGWDRIDAVQLTYPSGHGPGGVTTTARMGDQSGGSNQSPHGGVFDVRDNPVTIAAGLSGDILNAFNFWFQDGTDSGKLGGNAGGGSHFSFSYDRHILSSIHINGVSDYYKSADCAVFGFRYQEPAAGDAFTIPLGWSS